jgi:hypothetical protein
MNWRRWNGSGAPGRIRRHSRDRANASSDRAVPRAGGTLAIVVYQAYRPQIGRFAAPRGSFGGSHFSLGLMSWIKPNFLWMMYRSG